MWGQCTYFQSSSFQLEFHWIIVIMEIMFLILHGLRNPETKKSWDYIIQDFLNRIINKKKHWKLPRKISQENEMSRLKSLSRPGSNHARSIDARIFT